MNTPTPPHPHTPAPKSALIVFAKAPVAGQVKTRLTELLSEAEAARLYEAFVQDALAQYAALAERRGAEVHLYHAGSAWPARLALQGIRLHRQRGEDLGARMAAAFRDAFAAGARSALIVGTDHPTLPPSFVEKGFGALAQDAEGVCIGPSTDGGFYLLGMGHFRPSLFEGMTYSHAGVFRDTLARAAAECVPVVLPEWYDVDRPADLRRLAADLAADLAAGGPTDEPARAPQTRRQTRRLLEKYPSLTLAPRPR